MDRIDIGGFHPTGIAGGVIGNKGIINVDRRLGKQVVVEAVRKRN